MGEVNVVRHDWRDIFHAFKMAFDPKKMFLGYAGLLVSLAWCVTAMGFFSALKLVTITPRTFINLVLCSVKEGIPLIGKSFFSAVMPLDFAEIFVLLILVIGLLAIWSLVGGAITRIAALDYAKDESIRLADALKFARKKFWSYFWSPLVPVIGVFFFALCNVVGGMIGRIPVLGEVAVALGFPLALLSGFFMVFISVIGALGLCFMFPTISVEGSDAFDAMSRAYSYVLSRPKQFLVYCVINTLYGLACLAVIAFVAWLMMRLAFLTVGMGMGQKFSLIQAYISQKCNIACLGYCSGYSTEVKMKGVCLDGWRSLKILASILIVYVFLVKLAVWSFATTYLFSAKTIIYFLLRKEIDSTDVTDVYLEERQEETHAVTSGKAREKPSSIGDKNEDYSSDEENEQNA